MNSKQTHKIRFLFILLILQVLPLFAQVYNNNPCSLTYPICADGLTNTITIASTDNNDNTAPTPASCTGGSGGNGGYVTTPTAGGDVWVYYQVQNPVSTADTLVIETFAGTLTDIACAVYKVSNPCNFATYTQIACSRDKSGTNYMTKVALTSGVVPGDILLIRMWDESENQLGNFNLVVRTTNTLDEMDELNGLTVYASPTCYRDLFDSGGPYVDATNQGFYANNENYTVTYCGEKTNDHVYFYTNFIDPAIFPTNTIYQQLLLGTTTTGNDYLTFYDGPNTSSPQIGAYTGNTPNYPQPGTIISTGRCLTINFKSDPTLNTYGFSASILSISDNVLNDSYNTYNVTCGSSLVYTDNGGTGANYQDFSNDVKIYCPSDNSKAIWASFDPNSELETNADYLYVYDGNSTSAPLINAYTGGFTGTGSNLANFSPNDLNSLGIIKATTNNATGCLTFKFMSDGSVTKAGYRADISCGAKRLVDAANSGSTCGTATNIAQATTITTGQSFTYAGFNVNEYGNPGGTTAGTADPSLNIAGCTDYLGQNAGNSANDITRLENTMWFKFTTPAIPCPSLSFYINNISCQNINTSLNGGAGAQFILYKSNTCQTGANWNATKVYCQDKLTQSSPPIDLASMVLPNSTYYILIDGFTGQHCNLDINLACPSLLPIELASFKATPDKDYIRLDWQVLSAANVERYIIERSENGIDFSYITEKVAVSNHQNTINYTTDDYSAEKNNLYYYRLKTLDWDGKFSYSSVVSAILLEDGKMQISLFPNPASTNLYVRSLDTKSRTIPYIISDITGRIISSGELQTLKNVEQIRMLDISQLEKGHYIFSCLNNEGIQAIQFVIE